MKIITTKFEDVLILEPKIWSDSRGYFYESYNQNTLKELGLEYNFVQDNESLSVKGVLRGLHYQLPPHSQTKLVRVSQGEVLDVIVDIRPGSSTFGQSFSIILSSTNFKQMIVPRGFAHGYIVLSEKAVFNYKCDNYYHKESERSIHFNDKNLNIDWILAEDQWIVSDKDKISPSFDDHSIFI
jgi:dTDP-4-dehydrorhamnose 3,5-epimerase